MSNFKNASKSNQKTHRERSQLSSRAHLGILEKKKDYKLRAQDYQRKQKTIKTLKRKALDKNPDEFYFKMVKTRLEDGVHQTEDETPTYTEDQLKLMTSQDIKYINYRRSLELKKIEKMKSRLHLLDAEDKPQNKHIIFTESRKEAKKFKPAEFFDTPEELMDRTYNRPKKEQLRTEQLIGDLSDEALAKSASERAREYRELGKRVEREKQLYIVAQKMQVKKQLMDKKNKKTKMASETTSQAAVYKWAPKRQRW